MFSGTPSRDDMDTDYECHATRLAVPNVFRIAWATLPRDLPAADARQSVCPASSSRRTRQYTRVKTRDHNTGGRNEITRRRSCNRHA